MPHDSTRIRRVPILAAIVVVAVMLLSAAIGIGSVAQAQPAPSASAPAITPGYTACGAMATGIESDGRPLTGAFPGRFVGPDKRWHWCQPWVPHLGDPAMPRPSPDLMCPASMGYVEWTQGDAACNSIPPGAYTGNDTMLPRRRVGLQALIRSDRIWADMGKATHGWALYRCVALPTGQAEWRIDGASCEWRNGR